MSVVKYKDEEARIDIAIKEYYKKRYTSLRAARKAVRLKSLAQYRKLIRREKGLLLKSEMYNNNSRLLED